MYICLFVIFLFIILIILISYLYNIHLKTRHQIERFRPNDQPNICICMLYTDNISSYSKLAEKINREYADRHKYKIHVYRHRLSDRAAQWDKVLAVNYLLDTNLYDYVFWIDSDAYFNIQHLKLEDIILFDPSLDFHICDDLPQSNGRCLVNTGTFLIRNCTWSKKFLKDWWNHPNSPEYYHVPFHEQTILDQIVKTDSRRIKIYPTTSFNSDTNLREIDNYFVVHLMSQPAIFRKMKMTEYLIQNFPKLLEI